ncbi:hypothetical protein ACFL3G_06050 [Planctomycetota bacterium]
MKKIGGVPTRSEVTDTVQKHEDDMTEKVEDIDIVATDAETVDETLENLDFEGTAEGTEAIESAMEEAEDVTVEIFEEEDENLEEMQSDAEDYQDELQERTDSSEEDLGEIVDASGQIETQETIDKLVEAKSAVLEDIDFLNEEIEHAEEAIEETENQQQEHRSRVDAVRRK